MKILTCLRAWCPGLLLLGLGGVIAPGALAQMAPVWAHVQRGVSVSEAGRSVGRRIAVAADGSQYVLGTFEGALRLGTATLTTGAGQTHLFLVKYSPAGAVLWVNQLERGGSAFLHNAALALDAAGNAYLAGDFTTTLTLGATTLTSSAEDAYLVKYNAQGVLQWARQGGPGTSITSIAADAGGTLTLVGVGGSGNAFGGPALSGTGYNYYRVSPAGVLLTTRRINAGTGGFVRETVLALDGSGNAYLMGSFLGSPIFGTTALVNARNEPDLYLCKLNAEGECLWARRLGGPYNDILGGMAADAAGNITVGSTSATGTFGETYTPWATTLHVSRFTPQGALAWSRQIDPYGTRMTTIEDVAYDERGGAFVVGRLYGTADFGGIRLTSVGTQVFVARYDSQGNTVWADRAVGTNEPTDFSTGDGVAADAGGNIYITGLVGGSVAFGAQPSPAAVGRTNVFVAKLTPGSVLSARRPAASVLRAYPNPAAGHVALLLPAGGGQLVLTDALGRAARRQVLPAAAGETILSLAGLAPGLYQLHATLGNGQIARTQLAVE